MGLDMYLHAEKYVSGNERFDAQEASAFKALLKGTDPEVKKAALAVDFPSARIVFTVGYWRKANQIHSWFVRECQDGRDECQHTYVNRDKLRELREICLRLLVDKDEDVAEDLLAPQGGFFFGTTDYDEWYWKDLKSTVGILDRVLALPSDWSIYYRSSW